MIVFITLQYSMKINLIHKKKNEYNMIKIIKSYLIDKNKTIKI